MPARRCVSVGTASVSRQFLSQVGVLSKRMDESGWFLAWELPSTYPALCFKDIQLPSKTKVLPTLATMNSSALEFRYLGLEITTMAV